MPPLPVVPNALRVDFDWTVGADLGCSSRVLCAYSGEQFSSATAAQLAEDIDNGLGEAFPENFGSEVTLASIQVTDLSTDTGGQGEYTSAIVGTRTGGLIPASACVLANYLVNRRYRGGKPRNYLPWGTSSDLLNDRTWATASVAVFQAGVEAMISACIGADADGTEITSHVNISYYSGFTVRTKPSGRTENVSTPRVTPLVDSISAAVVSPTIGSQRRRIRGK